MENVNILFSRDCVLGIDDIISCRSILKTPFNIDILELGQGLLTH